LYISKYTPYGLKCIRELPKNVRNTLKKEFETTIHKDPIGCSEELTGPLADFRSYHFLNYRVVYRIFEDLNAIAVVGVGEKDANHQAEIYKKLETLAKTGELADTVLRTIRLFSTP